MVGFAKGQDQSVRTAVKPGAVGLQKHWLSRNIWNSSINLDLNVRIHAFSLFLYVPRAYIIIKHGETDVSLSI